MDNREIEALIKLLDDPDKNVYKAIHNKLYDIGTEIIPVLEQAWNTSTDELLQSRIENIIQEIHQEHIANLLHQWSKTEDQNLLEGAILISQFQYPGLDVEQIKSKIDQIRRDIWIELNSSLTALEKIRVVNHVFFDIHEFRRSKSFFSNVYKYFINTLVNTKNGAPSIMAILYAGICQQLNIPVYGVDIPDNFILCYKDENAETLGNEFSKDTLFYINTYNKGVVFGKKEVDAFIEQQKIDRSEVILTPISNKDSIIILIKEIKNFFEKKNEKTKANYYNTLLTKL